MFASPIPGVTRPSTYEALRNSNAISIEGENHDVFGDGTVIIKAAPGTPKGIRSCMSGWPGRVMSCCRAICTTIPKSARSIACRHSSSMRSSTRAARKALDRLLEKTKAQLWIQHDFNAHAKLKKAPDYYD